MSLVQSFHLMAQLSSDGGKKNMGWGHELFNNPLIEILTSHLLDGEVFKTVSQLVYGDRELKSLCLEEK